MRFNCPCCGERSVDEFVYHGDASVIRPDPASPAALQDFIAYSFERTNAAGDHLELWYHASGCHLWLVVTRNLMTHTIVSIESARDAASARAAGGKGAS